MTVLDIQGSERLITRAILYYGAKCYLDDKKEGENIKLAFDGVFHNHQKANPSINFILPTGETKIEENGNKYVFTIKEEGDPVCEPTVSGYYLAIKIKADVPVEEIRAFIKRAYTYYHNFIRKEKNNKDTIEYYMYDDFWDLLCSHPRRKKETLYLPEKSVDNIVEDVRTFLKEETRLDYIKHGVPYKRNYMFYGPPGTGKSSLISVIASELDMNINIIHFTPSLDDNAFSHALRNREENSILVLEDIDVLFHQRKNNDEYKNMISFSALLNHLDGIGYDEGLIIIMTTNYPDRIDSAAKRPGRIDFIYQFKYILKGQLEKMFKDYFPEQNFAEFYTEYKKLKLKKMTTAIVQKFFFENRKSEKIVNDLSKLETIVEIFKTEYSADDNPLVM